VVAIGLLLLPSGSLSYLAASASCPLAGDVDRSGRCDAIDVQLVINAVLRLNALDAADLNYDTKSDAIDVQLVINAVLNLPVDGDGDGLCDQAEANIGTDAGLWDTDGDGVCDGQEMLDGTDPLRNDTAGATVPDVTGLSQYEAEAALTAAGLVPGTVATANDDSVAAGLVLSQEPPAGASAAMGSAVNLVISLGPAGSIIPPDPADVAPPLDPTIPTRIFDATRFL
jgi:hypothetical protein